ncbi:hypothetical protein ACHAPJ_013284 [Fusarium lateritium]
MQFSIITLLAIATAAMAAPKASCSNGGLFYSDRHTLEPCKSECVGGTCALFGDCGAEIPNVPTLCLAKCTC